MSADKEVGALLQELKVAWKRIEVLEADNIHLAEQLVRVDELESTGHMRALVQESRRIEVSVPFSGILAASANGDRNYVVQASSKHLQTEAVVEQLLPLLRFSQEPNTQEFIGHFFALPGHSGHRIWR